MKRFITSRWRRYLWFIGLYCLSIIVIGGITFLLRLLVGLPV